MVYAWKATIFPAILFFLNIVLGSRRMELNQTLPYVQKQDIFNKKLIRR